MILVYNLILGIYLYWKFVKRTCLRQSFLIDCHAKAVIRVSVRALEWSHLVNFDWNGDNGLMGDGKPIKALKTLNSAFPVTILPSIWTPGKEQKPAATGAAKAVLLSFWNNRICHFYFRRVVTVSNINRALHGYLKSGPIRLTYEDLTCKRQYKEVGRIHPVIWSTF